jgi:hypothetical protein
MAHISGDAATIPMDAVLQPQTTMGSRLSRRTSKEHQRMPQNSGWIDAEM